MAQVYFTKKQKLNPQPCKPEGFPASTELAKECDRCLERAYHEESAAPLGEVQEPEEFLEFRKLHMDPAVQRLGGKIEEIQHLHYRERYRCISSQNTLAVLDFCYNGKREFRKKPEIQSETTDKTFAQSIIRELER